MRGGGCFAASRRDPATSRLLRNCETSAVQYGQQFFRFVNDLLLFFLNQIATCNLRLLKRVEVFVRVLSFVDGFFDSTLAVHLRPSLATFCNLSICKYHTESVFFTVESSLGIYCGLTFAGNRLFQIGIAIVQYEFQLQSHWRC